MALMQLKDIGKIYVSEGNVSVGIRGVNLSFELGEFVAVTGKSGSGKSTLLSVISGMDSYEEGELYIEDQPTSHYLQADLEKYRKKYISFIFQDYNIIDSFTVLQNVELALMHIEDKKQRRKRALELIERVGLSSQVKQKGSRLSGGQKQRTVIARALAKDSPIILADEPTGNLDSQSSREIIELLREVSTDKLLIVVTHNFEEVREYATRHIRIFDGSIESDHVLKETVQPDKAKETASVSNKKQEMHYLIKNGFHLGQVIFTAKPKLSAFLCMLMIIGTLGIFLITSLCGDSMSLFEPNYMFNHIEGRLILTNRNGEVLSEGQVEDIAKKYGATDYLRFDSILDSSAYNTLILPVGANYYDYIYLDADPTYRESFGEDILGRYPAADNEVFLYVPISYKNDIGSDSIQLEEISYGNIAFKLVGVKYYYDNNLTPKCLFTENGFRTVNAMKYLTGSSFGISINIASESGADISKFSLYEILPSFDIKEDKIWIDSEQYQKNIAELDGKYDVYVDFTANYYKYNYSYVEFSKSLNFEREFTKKDLSDEAVTVNYYNGYREEQLLIVSDEILRDIAETVLSDSYKQVSLFFENDKAAHIAAEKLQDDGFIAVPSDTTYEPDPIQTIANTIVAVMTAILWITSIIFLAFFINLCSGRVLGAFKTDMAIMRSMGISVNVIRIAMYVRMLLALIPAFAAVILTAILIFTTPSFNSFFSYLYLWQYALIFLGMIFLSVRTTYKQIRKLFGESVKKSLKGGAAE